MPRRRALLFIGLLAVTAGAQEKKCVCPPRVVELCTADHRRTTLATAKLIGSDALGVLVGVSGATDIPFTLDTSEARTKMPPKLLADLGYTKHAPKDAPKNEPFSGVTPSVLSIGNQIWTYPRLLVDEKRDFGKVGGKSVGGVFGNDLLSQTEFLLDLQNKRIVFFFTRDAIFARVNGKPVKRVKLLPQVAGGMAIAAAINGKPVAVLIATKEATPLVNAPAAQLIGSATTFAVNIGEVALNVPAFSAGDAARFARVKADKMPAIILPASVLTGKMLYFSPAMKSFYLAEGGSCPVPPPAPNKKR